MQGLVANNDQATAAVPIMVQAKKKLKLHRHACASQLSLKKTFLTKVVTQAVVQFFLTHIITDFNTFLMEYISHGGRNGGQIGGQNGGRNGCTNFTIYVYWGACAPV